jgi:hypothetical protein
MLLKWTATGLGNPEDYTGKDADHPRAYCRVYKSTANSPAGRGSGPPRTVTLTSAPGYAAHSQGGGDGSRDCVFCETS